MTALMLLGLFAVATLVGIISTARRSTQGSEVEVTRWNARAERARGDAEDSPASRTPGGAA